MPSPARQSTNQIEPWSTTARILPAYHSSSSARKLVDFCLYIDPAAVTNPGHTTNAITNTRRHRPDQSINHTGYAPLRHRPIILSAESKRPGEKMLDAQLQVGVWQAAHWTVLEDLIRKRTGQTLLQRSSLRTASQSDEAQVATTVESPKPQAISGDETGEDASLGQKLPDFLPAVIIQGHDWYFVATTRDLGRTVRLSPSPLFCINEL